MVLCQSKGVNGVSIDGAVRDVEEMNDMGIAVFARAVCSGRTLQERAANCWRVRCLRQRGLQSRGHRDRRPGSRPRLPIRSVRNTQKPSSAGGRGAPVPRPGQGHATIGLRAEAVSLTLTHLHYEISPILWVQRCGPPHGAHLFPSLQCGRPNDRIPQCQT
ncbi:RraA family protein [Pseudarthrobacter chlorophenolicus]|uniref:RraA family protein n=1 Tax=Pseudarthrobacter chlorophenolicus TaxID=85085 RepID=UPI001FCBDCE1|nr:RraA family protein [Pseudarthrobacter chlorophenolicus]